MLKIFNDLGPFFEDNYRRIHVREYAKLVGITPPTASKLLERLCSENLLKKIIDKQYYYYYTNKDSFVFKELQRLYWKLKLAPLTDYIEEKMISPVIILFGSVSKAEITESSDIDLAIFSSSKKGLNVSKFEKGLNRELQVFTFKDLEDVPKELKNNILNGYILGGSW